MCTNGCGDPAIAAYSVALQWLALLAQGDECCTAFSFGINQYQ